MNGGQLKMKYELLSIYMIIWLLLTFETLWVAFEIIFIIFHSIFERKQLCRLSITQLRALRKYCKRYKRRISCCYCGKGWCVCLSINDAPRSLLFHLEVSQSPMIKKYSYLERFRSVRTRCILNNGRDVGISNSRDKILLQHVNRNMSYIYIFIIILDATQHR